VSAAVHEFRALSRLAVPVVITQVATMLPGVVDIVMVGRVSVDAINAVALGRLWLFGTLLFGMGIVFGIDPLIAQAHGRRDERTMGLALQRGAVLAAIISIPLAGLWLLTAPVLRLFGQDPAFARLAQDYVWIQIPGLLPFLLYIVLRQYLQDRAIVRPVMWTVVAATALNVLLDWMLIFGRLGAPAMGVEGAGLAATISRFVMFALLIAITFGWKLHRGGWIPLTREALRPSGLREILLFGLPVGLQLSLEIWAFEIATLLAGRLGGVELAAHTIAINLASLSFMVPLGVSLAAVTRVGNLIGERRPEEAQTAAWVAIGMGAGVMTLSGAVFVTLRYALPRLYTPDLAVIAATAAVLPIAAMFQIFDGTQVVGGGILRGMGRTRPAAVFNLVGYYCLALPLAGWLAFSHRMGLPGIWWGMALGLASVACMLVVFVWRRGPRHAVPVDALKARP
jgi:MATE family multidrug resistance protein